MNISSEPLFTPAKQNELIQLWLEFQQHYRGSAAADTLRRALVAARQLAQQHYAQILAQAQGDESLTDAVLLKLLPYADTPRNRWRGAWIHPTPAVVGDLRSWYEAAGWTQPDEWGAIAQAILHFVRQCVDEPTQLATACQNFRRFPYTRGFQSGILSPILNALRPEQYLLLNHHARRTLNYFTDRAYTPALTDYPAANAALQHVGQALFDHPEPAQTDPRERHDQVLLFCHWLVTERDFRFRPRRYWTLGLAEESWLWQEWREGNMITMGWDELGDLSGIRKREFGQRRDSLIAQHPTWRKGSAEQVWRFARQVQEGDQLLIHRGNLLLGLGTISGPYYYVPEVAQGHRYPVEWTDLTPRRLPGTGWGATFAAISAERLLALATAPVVEMPEPPSPRTTEGEAPPAFVHLLVPLVNTLQALGGQGRTSEVIEAVFARVATPKTKKKATAERQKQQLYQARRLLVRAGLLDANQRGLWRLTKTGQALNLTEATAASLFAETLYQQRLAASLQDESSTIRRLAESPVTYTIQPSSQSKSEPATLAEPPEPTALPPTVETVAPPYSLAACAVATFLPEAMLRRWVSALERKGQAIFYGPPGVGKTFLAEQVAAHLVGGTDGFVEVVQFHAAYAYEDFVQGIRPVAGPHGEVRYAVIAGRFLAFCQRAAHCSGRCVLIIDEINRADLARVFGELMYLLEYRERTVRLAADGRTFAIPANVRLIGTMNTADRSIALLDHALRRRFAFIALQPDVEVLRRFHRQNATGFAVDGLIDLLRRVNSEIGDAHYAIGHSFFLRTDLATELPDIWQLEIEPYLEEYFFDQPDRVAAFRWAQVKGPFGD
ncbi:MAG: AAA family ATPase [Caldilineaceae bacterium]|nr:AAA family ATPase [Caldilineaceae bacterium]